MKSRWRGILMVGAVVVALVSVGCSDDGEAVTGTGAGDADTAESAAPETTAAPQTTAAPDTTAASGGSSSDTDGGSTADDSSNEALWALVIIAGVLIIGLIAWGASRSGARKGAEEQAQQDTYGDDAPPPPPSG